MDIVNERNIETVSKAASGKLLRDGGGARMGLPERIDAILNSTEHGDDDRARGC